MLRYLIWPAFPVIMYPLALALVIFADSLLGDAEFLRSFLLDSKRRTLIILLNDWLYALPWCLLAWLLIRVSHQRVGQYMTNISILILSCFLLIASLSTIYLPLLFSALAITALLLNLTYCYWISSLRRP